jgi:hypothetical protein
LEGLQLVAVEHWFEAAITPSSGENGFVLGQRWLGWCSSLLKADLRSGACNPIPIKRALQCAIV